MKRPTRAELLADAERILRMIHDGRDELHIYSDIRDWLRAAAVKKRTTRKVVEA